MEAKKKHQNRKKFWFIILFILGVAVFTGAYYFFDKPEVLQDIMNKRIVGSKTLPSQVQGNFTFQDKEFIALDDGLILIKEGDKVLGKFGFALTGEISGNQQVRTSQDFTWSWQSRVEERINVINETDNETYIINIFTAYNNAPNFNWTQEWTFDKYKGAKIKHILTNNLGIPIQNTKFWYVNQIKEGDTIKINGKDYTIPKDNIHLTNIDHKVNKIDFGVYGFSYQDLINNGFEVTDVYLGDGYLIGNQGVKIFAIGVTKGIGTFPDGFTIELDPIVTSYKEPTEQAFIFNDWDTPENIEVSDNNYANATAEGQNLSLHTFNFEDEVIPMGSTINGIQLQIEHKAVNTVGLSFDCSGVQNRLRLSWNNGTTWTSGTGDKTVSQGQTEGTDLVGGLTDTWGRTWVYDEFNNGNFTVWLQWDSDFDRFGGDGECELSVVDYLAVRVNYTAPVPAVEFADPTPANDSVIGATLRVNVSSDITLAQGGCTLEENSTGTFVNHTMSIQGFACSTNLLGLPDNTEFQYTVYANAGGDENMTETRIASTSNLVPEITLNSPENDSTVSEDSVLLNWTNTDGNGDIQEVTLYASNDTNTLNEAMLYRALVENGTHTVNFSFPLTEYPEGLYALYHLDNNSFFGESETFVYDFVNGRNNGTPSSTGASDDAFPIRTGRFGGGYKIPDLSSRIVIGNNGTSFSEVCDNGCSFSVWVNKTQNSTLKYILARFDTKGNNRFMNLRSSPDNTVSFLIGFDGDAGTDTCNVNSVNKLTLDEWSHVVGVFNQTDVLIYLDGILESTTACNFIGVNTTAWDDSENMTIANGDSSVGYTGGFLEEIDEVAIFNRTLNSTEISDMRKLTTGQNYYWQANITDFTDSNFSEQRQFTTGAADSCSYTSGDWNVDCADNCVISSDVDGGANSLFLTGSGTFTIQTGVRIMFDYIKSDRACYIQGQGSGGFF